jgi:hypothetical protein
MNQIFHIQAQMKFFLYMQQPNNCMQRKNLRFGFSLMLAVTDWLYSPQLADRSKAC